MPSFKTLFIAKVLKEEQTYYLKNQELAMRKRLHFHTGNIISGRSGTVTSGNNNADGVLTIKHTAYERFLDIKTKKRSKKTNRLSIRARRIHNRFVFGHYYKIGVRLITEYTEEARAAIIKEFNANNNG